MHGYPRHGQSVLGLLSSNLSKVLCLMVLSLVLGTTARADYIRIGRQREAAAEKGSAEYFSKPFNGVFESKVTDPKYKDPAPAWRFYDDGRAVMFHDSMYPLYECYYYTVEDGVISLEGVCCLRSSAGMKMLPEKPADLVLEVVSYGKDATLAGSEAGKSGRGFELTLSSSDHISRFGNGNDLAEIMACRARGIASSSENLFVVTQKEGAVAWKSPEEGGAVVKFGYGDIFQGHMSDDGSYVLVDYIGGTQLYVYVYEASKVTGEDMLQDILYANAEAGLDFTRWQGTFQEKEWKADTAGYFNGAGAGRQSANVFVVLLFVALLLLVLNKLYPPFFANFLFYITYAAVVVITLFELWYVFSLGKDALWFITDPKDFVHGFAAAVGMLVFLFLQVELILSLEMSFGEIYCAYSRCPFWVELVLSVLALFAALPLVLSGEVKWILCAYLLLLVATLPTSVGYMRHSSHRLAVLPFLLLCYPFKYIVMLPLILLYVFGRASKTKVSFDSSEDGITRTVRDMEGNTVNLNQMSNGDLLDNDGNAFTNSGGGYSPNGVDRKGGPYR